MSARYLRRDGLQVRLVTTPEQALAELTGGPDAVAVLDLTMPGLDPRRIRRALRTPVIFLVAGLQGPRPRGLARSGGTTGPRRWLARPLAPGSWLPWSATCWPRRCRRQRRARNQPGLDPGPGRPEPGLLDGPSAGSGWTPGL